MTKIVDFLNAERDQCLPLVKSILSDQRQQYAGLTPEFAELLDHIETYLLRGGKWHRPALGLLAYQLAGGTNVTAARHALVALEIMHRYILAHDDIIDRDLMRHGGPTIEKIYTDRFQTQYSSKTDAMYGKGNALVAGDVIHSIVYDHILASDFSESIRITAVRNLARLMIETAAGWQLQMEQNFKAIPSLTETEFFHGMQLVSAQYSIVWPLRMGQIFAGKLTPESWDQHLETYGWHAGAAFQIMDDILGMFGKQEATGKPVGHDYREGKKTFLVLHAYANASKDDQIFLENTLGTDIDAEKLRQVQNIIRNTGSLEYSKTKAQEHASRAKNAVSQLTSPQAELVDLLAELADFLAHRDF